MIKYIEMDAIINTKNSGDNEYEKLINLLMKLNDKNCATLLYKIAQKKILKQVVFSNDSCFTGCFCCDTRILCCEIRDDINTNYLCLLLCCSTVKKIIISIENKMTNYAFLIANLPVIADIRANILKSMLYIVLGD